MAVSDVVSDIQDIVNGANLDFQPAAGVEVGIFAFISEINSAAVQVKATNGTLVDGLWFPRPVLGSTLAQTPQVKIFLTNTVYLRITNDGGVNNIFGYSGIQIK